MLSPQSGTIYCSLEPALLFQNPDHQLLLPSCSSDLLLSIPSELSAFAKQARIKTVLRQVGMEGMESRPIHTLSGGQKQRLALAGALASNSNLLLLDEPTALLDPINQRSILNIILELSHRPKNPITTIWITHRLEELHSCDSAAIMEKGRVGKWFQGKELIRRLN